MDINDIYKLISKGFNRKNSKVPISTVYHYTSPEGLMGIFKENSPKLYFSQYDSLNDYKERFDIIEFMYGYCDHQVKAGIMPKALCDDIKNITLSDEFFITTNMQTKTGFKSQTEISGKDCYTYICSFSLEEDLLPMWRMYSKSEHYEGFCIGILSDIFKRGSCYGKGYKIELRKVIYSDGEKDSLLKELLAPIYEHYMGLDEFMKAECLKIITRFIFENQFVFKNKAFEYEKELRAILHIPKEQEGAFENISERKYRQIKGMIVPYVEFELPINSIRSINLAPNVKEEISKNNLKDFLSSKGYKNVAISSSNIPIRSM